jgi:hypothetical protein
MTLGNHLGANQDIHLASVNLVQLFLQAVFGFGGVGINSQNAHRALVFSSQTGQGLHQVFFKPFGADTQHVDVLVGTSGAFLWHPLRITAVMTFERAVAFVKNFEGGAFGALTFPAASAAVQHWRVTSAVEQHENLLVIGKFFSHGIQKRLRDECVLGLKVHVHTLELW